MTPHDRQTLRAVCEAALARAEGKSCPPTVLLPASAVLALLDASEPTTEDPAA